MSETALVLREITLPRLLWRAWRGDKPLVAFIDAITSPGAQLLERILQRLRARGLAEDVVRDRADLLNYTTINEVLLWTDGYVASEPWQAEYFRYAETDRSLGGYAYPYRDLCSGHVQKKLVPLMQSRDLAAAGIALDGVAPEMAGLYRTCLGEDAPAGWRWSAEPRRLLNMLLAAAAALVAAVDVARRIRPNQQTERRYFLGSDFIDDPRDKVLWRDLADAPGPLMVVFRSDAQAAACRDKVTEWNSASVTAGRFSLSAGLAAMTEAVSDVGRLWRHCNRLPPDLFFALALLPFKRMRIRALLARFHFDHFWSRDDYNTEHILRSQELRRVGAKSIGMSHGFHCVSRVVQQTRYVDYDTYFCFGRDLCRRHIAATWPSHMRLRNISSFGLGRDDLRRVGSGRSKDIAVILILVGGDKPWWPLIRRLAEAFPDRRVLFNAKETIRRGAFRDGIEAFLADCPPNVAEYRSTEGRKAYDLLFGCSYLLAAGTTLLTEAVHMGVHAFGIDIDPKWKSNPQRDDLPGLFVKSADEAVRRIRGIEDGTYHYPREQWAGDIDLDGHVIWDKFREELGLPPKDGTMDNLRLLPPEPKRTCA